LEISQKLPEKKKGCHRQFSRLTEPQLLNPPHHNHANSSSRAAQITTPSAASLAQTTSETKSTQSLY